MDKEKIEYHIREIIIALGDDPEREGLKETPKRVAQMYEEVFEGMKYTNDEIANMFDKTFSEPHNGDLVVVRDIPAYSYCEHHMALIYNMNISIIYRPVDKVIGLSKLARIADMVSKRLQLQERIGADIASIVAKITGSDDVGVLIEAEHSCMSSRGINKIGTVTRTTTLRGAFEHDKMLRQEVLLLLMK
ncbi:MAG: GTP cyclohydrolase I FolE [Epulopiscium sp. Nele67-Bin001]|nr:MAG: GTP cyclohydrolase I FolE [Epulopiscium sp. Nuni2H_MBin001]OON92250.1 MAG: GTP cyclohydrolase I FolE [Epulopiscium sp. Nele67-Bin001]